VRAAQLGAAAASTCLALDAGVLAVGASDGTLSLWRAPCAGGAPPSAAGGGGGAPERPSAVLRGHGGAAVTAVALCARQDVVASGAAGGRCLLHALGTGALVRALPVMPPPPAHDGIDGGGASASVVATIALLAVSCDGAVAVHALSGPHAGLQVWTLNGVRLAQAALPEPLLALAFTPDGRHLLTAGHANAVLRATHSLDAVAALPAAAPQPLAAAALSPDGTLVVVGLADGSVALYRTPPLPH
jgi:hypothetical protein